MGREIEWPTKRMARWDSVLLTKGKTRNMKERKESEMENFMQITFHLVGGVFA